MSCHGFRTLVQKTEVGTDTLRHSLTNCLQLHLQTAKCVPTLRPPQHLTVILCLHSANYHTHTHKRTNTNTNLCAAFDLPTGRLGSTRNGARSSAVMTISVSMATNMDDTAHYIASILLVPSPMSQQCLLFTPATGTYTQQLLLFHNRLIRPHHLLLQTPKRSTTPSLCIEQGSVALSGLSQASACPA